MNDTFNLRRFAHLAYKHYWENKPFYIIAIVSLIVALLCFSPIPIIGKSQVTTFNYINGVSQSVRSFYEMSRTIAVLFFVGITSISISDRESNKLLPSSSFEQYIFVVLNSTVVAYLIYFVIYSIVTTFIESHIYIMQEVTKQDNSTILLPIFDISKDAVDLTLHQKANLSLMNFDVMKTWRLGQYLTPLSAYMLNCSVCVYIIAVFVWCRTVFKQRGIVVPLLILLYWVGSKVFCAVADCIFDSHEYMRFDDSIGLTPTTMALISILPLIPAAMHFVSGYHKFKRL